MHFNYSLFDLAWFALMWGIFNKPGIFIPSMIITARLTIVNNGIIIMVYKGISGLGEDIFYIFSFSDRTCGRRVLCHISRTCNTPCNAQDSSSSGK